MIKAASIGLGWWSDELAKSIQGKSKKIKIVSCYSKSKKKRIDFSKKYKTNYHDSYTALLKDPTIDAVILTTPHSMHAKHAIQAMKNGKHVFVEKPMATKYLDAKKMIDVAKKYNKTLSVGHNRRYSSVSDFINNLNRQKKIGKILHIEANYSAPGALKYNKKYWRANRVESPGGSVAALGIHMIDLMCYFGGAIKSVLSLVKKFAVKVNMDDTTSALFEFKKNCTGNLTTIFASPNTTTFNVFGTNMNIFADVDGNKIKIFHKNRKIEILKLKKKNTLFLELQEFSDNCYKKKKYKIKNSEAAHNVKIMEAIVQSSKKNKKILIS